MKLDAIKANIPSKRDFLVNENGEIFGAYGRVLMGKHNPNSKTLRSLDFLNIDGKRQMMSFQKIVWNTFYPNDMVKEGEIIVLKDSETKYPFALSNLTKVERKENVKTLNVIRLGKLKTNLK